MDTSVITDATDRLRKAVLAARAAPSTYRTAMDFASDIEATLDALRRELERQAPIECRIAGVFYALGDPPSVRLCDGDLLTLRREPENRADADAVAVCASCGTRCGYLPRSVAADLAPALDAGLEAVAVTTRASGTAIDIELSGPAVVARNTRAAVYDDMPW